MAATGNEAVTLAQLKEFANNIPSGGASGQYKIINHGDKLGDYITVTTSDEESVIIGYEEIKGSDKIYVVITSVIWLNKVGSVVTLTMDKNAFSIAGTSSFICKSISPGGSNDVITDTFNITNNKINIDGGLYVSTHPNVFANFFGFAFSINA